MDLQPLLTALSSPAAYPFAVDQVTVRQTHISAVFLAGPYAYKIRKPLRLPFLDFASLAKRRHDCEEEVRLNRRLAPDVYLGVVPIVWEQGGAKVEASGTPVEWAVKMVRLPDEATLAKRLGQEPGLPASVLTALARRLAAFHSGAATDARIAEFGRFDAVTRNIGENLTQAIPEIGITLTRSVYKRLQALTDTTLTRLRPLIEARAARGMPRDTHGDLHLDHVYLFPGRPPPGDIVIVDCIEFNERFRFADPIADMAFLAMDLSFHGRNDLAKLFIDAYFAASGDEEGRALLPLYLSYRAAVRGKVEGFELEEPEIPAAEKSSALVRAKAHWLLALRSLEVAGQRPCLVLIGGLPGTGKSTLARQLADRAGFEIIRSDVVRKELFAKRAEPPADSKEDLYTAARSERTYAECLTRAETLLWHGSRVIIDANFRQEAQRRLFFDAARRWCVPILFFVCQCNSDAVRHRLASRHSDASDADWAVYQKLAATWEEPSSTTKAATHVLNTDRDAASATKEAAALLVVNELLG